jgi:hypothetical protein
MELLGFLIVLAGLAACFALLVELLLPRAPKGSDQ